MPFDPVLTLETAALMLVAFLVGATIGSLLRLGVLSLRQTPVAAANAISVPKADAAVALVAAPVIAPLAVPRGPSVPKDVPVPDFAGAMAEPAASAELAPARKPGVATFGRDVGRHDRKAPELVPEPAAEPLPATEALQTEPDVIPIPESLPAAAAPGTKETAEPDNDTSIPASEDKSDATETPVTLEQIDVAAELLVIAPVADVAEIGATPAEPDLSASDPDEAAAMRAIEGSWTPGRRPQPVVPPAEPVAQAPVEAVETASAAAAELPEFRAPADEVEVAIVPEMAVVEDGRSQDDDASHVAEDDNAEAAVPEVAPLAEVPDVIPQHEEDRIVPAEASDEPEPEPEPEPDLRREPILAAPVAQDQPPGLGAPRYGMRDDLTQIVGVLPVVESTLNRLGVYHFDQVADWSDAHAGWVETHLGIAGRVDREQWREQARELAAIASGKRPSRKKRPS